MTSGRARGSRQTPLAAAGDVRGAKCQFSFECPAISVSKAAFPTFCSFRPRSTAYYTAKIKHEKNSSGSERVNSITAKVFGVKFSLREFGRTFSSKISNFEP